MKLSKSDTETLQVLHEAFRERSVSWTMISEWHSHAKDHWVSDENDERSGQPNTSKMTENVERIQALIIFVENETESMTFWNIVWHPNGITSYVLTSDCNWQTDANSV